MKQTFKNIKTRNSDRNSRRQVSWRETDCDPSSLPNNTARRYHGVYIPNITRQADLHDQRMKERRRETVIAGYNSPSQFSNCNVRRACKTARRTSVSFRYCVARVMNVVASYSRQQVLSNEYFCERRNKSWRDTGYYVLVRDTRRQEMQNMPGTMQILTPSVRYDGHTYCLFAIQKRIVSVNTLVIFDYVPIICNVLLYSHSD